MVYFLPGYIIMLTYTEHLTSSGAAYVWGKKPTCVKALPIEQPILSENTIIIHKRLHGAWCVGLKRVSETSIDKTFKKFKVKEKNFLHFTNFLPSFFSITWISYSFKLSLQRYIVSFMHSQSQLFFVSCIAAATVLLLAWIMCFAFVWSCLILWLGPYL